MENIQEVTDSDLPLIRAEHVRNVFVDFVKVLEVGQVQDVDDVGAR